MGKVLKVLKPVASICAALLKRGHNFLAKRSFSVFIFAALFCTLLVKLFQFLRIGRFSLYPQSVLADIAVLLTIEIVLFVICFFLPRRICLRLATIIATLIFAWSIINAGWLLRTGKQFLPLEFFPLIRDPLTTLCYRCR